MKKFFTVIACVMMASASFGQSVVDLAKEKHKEDMAIAKYNGDVKPDKDTKKQIKALRKEGWAPVPGDPSIERQLMEAQILKATPMLDEEGNRTVRYIVEPGRSTSGSYNVAYAAARAAALNQVATSMKTELFSALKSRMDNAQSNRETSVSNDEFMQRIEAVVNQSITNSTTPVSLSRTLPNKNFEVLVQVAFDKKEIAAQLKRELKKELKEEGDELFDVIDDMMSSKF